MNKEKIKRILEGVKKGEIEIEKAMEEFKNFPFKEIGFATVDHHRELRQGFPEVIFGEGKSVSQIVGIINSLLESGSNILVTRLSEEKGEEIVKIFPQGIYSPISRTFVIKKEVKIRGKGEILIITAGTSDINVAEEAYVTAEILGNKVERMYDVGVAGVHRLLNQYEKIASANVIIVVAGMEGALPSVVGGLVNRPIIAVPTSVGYGTSFKGISALLGMLNSCASNVAVVNIDNGFGAGFIASLINRDRE